MVYDESWDGREIDAQLKEELEVSLAEIRTAGYRWVTKKNGEPILRLLEDKSAPNTAAVGGAGRHLWRFQAVLAGEAELKLESIRLWETSEPARTFVLKVRVRS